MFSNEGTEILEGETLLVWNLQQTMAHIKRQSPVPDAKFAELRDELELIVDMSENPTIVRRASDMLMDLDGCLSRLERYA